MWNKSKDNVHTCDINLREKKKKSTDWFIIFTLTLSPGAGITNLHERMLLWCPSFFFFFFPFSFPPKRHLLTCGELLAALTAFKLGNLATKYDRSYSLQKEIKKKVPSQLCHALFSKVVATQLTAFSA